MVQRVLADATLYLALRYHHKKSPRDPTGSKRGYKLPLNENTARGHHLSSSAGALEILVLVHVWPFFLALGLFSREARKFFWATFSAKPGVLRKTPGFALKVAQKNFRASREKSPNAKKKGQTCTSTRISSAPAEDDK